MAMAKQDDWVRITVRLPSELHASLLSAVAEGPNSLNAEIVSRLHASLSPGEAIQPSKTAIREVVMETTGQVIRSVLEAFDTQPKDRRDNINEIIMRAGTILDENSKS